jgi:hypothetical protein
MIRRVADSRPLPRPVQPASAIRLPLHADLVLLAERSRDFFSRLTRRQFKRGVFRSIVDLQDAIKLFIGGPQRAPKTFVWTADPDAILDKVTRGTRVLASLH